MPPPPPLPARLSRASCCCCGSVAVTSRKKASRHSASWQKDSRSALICSGVTYVDVLLFERPAVVRERRATPKTSAEICGVDADSMPVFVVVVVVVLLGPLRVLEEVDDVVVGPGLGVLDSGRIRGEANGPYLGDCMFSPMMPDACMLVDSWALGGRSRTDDDGFGFEF